jgi:hypothetical protein
MKNPNFKPVSVPKKNFDMLTDISKHYMRSKSDTLRILITNAYLNGMPELTDKVLDVLDEQRS